MSAMVNRLAPLMGHAIGGDIIDIMLETGFHSILDVTPLVSNHGDGTLLVLSPGNTIMMIKSFIHSQRSLFDGFPDHRKLHWWTTYPSLFDMEVYPISHVFLEHSIHMAVE